MKDIEKIQSPDLGCQVQDANPGNFAIEQEVGAMVGATVPAPTEPSADDARELGAQLLVFLRRALLPIRSALRTALAAIYANLDSRCTDYTPAAYAPYQPLPSYDPMGTPPTPRTLPNLLTAITAFAPRKISNGSAPNDGIKDGTSLARLISGDYASVTEIKDDTPGWIYNRDIFSLFPNATKFTLLCKETTRSIANDVPRVTDLVVPYLSGDYSAYKNNNNTPIIVAKNIAARRLEVPGKFNVITESARTWQVSLAISCANLEEVVCGTERIDCNHANSANSVGFIANNPVLKKIIFTNLNHAYYYGGNAWYTVYNNPLLEEVDASKLAYYYRDRTDYFIYNCPSMKKLILGTMTTSNKCPFDSSSSVALQDIVLGDGTACNLMLDEWNPTDKGTTFLQNFLNHICKNLAKTGQTKLTLTLSAAVYTAIMTDNDIKAELVARNWKVTDGTNNYNN